MNEKNSVYPFSTSPKESEQSSFTANSGMASSLPRIITAPLWLMIAQPRVSALLLLCGTLASATLAHVLRDGSYFRSFTLCLSLALSLLLGSLLIAIAVSQSLRGILDKLVEIRERARQFGIEREIPPAEGADRLSGPTILQELAQCATGATISLPQLALTVEAAVEQLIEHYELMTTNIAASVLIWTVDGRLVFCSPYTQVLTGYSLEDFSDSADDFFANLVIDEDRERYQRAVVVSRLGEDILVRYRIQHRSGLRLWLETRLVPISDEHDNVVTIMGVTIDVTDSLNYQRQIELQNRDLSDFAYMVSHDLKAPIFTIKGMASAMTEDYGETLDEDAQQMLRYIIDGSERLEKLVASVIEYSSLSTKESHIIDVDLNQTLANVVADLGELIKRKDAAIHIEDNLPSVRADQIRIYQVFSNLLGNALKYSSPERKPEISVRLRSRQRASLVIEVSDNGLGIPSAKLDDVFRPYRRAHGNIVEGSGIGLACVKKIIDQLNGAVSVTSVEGQGSTFSLEFPSTASTPRAIPVELARCFEQ